MKKKSKRQKTLNEALVKTDEFGNLIAKPLKEVYKDKEHKQLFKDFALNQVADLARAKMYQLKEIISLSMAGEIECKEALERVANLKQEFLKSIEEDNITELIPMIDVQRIWSNQLDMVRTQYNGGHKG